MSLQVNVILILTVLFERKCDHLNIFYFEITSAADGSCGFTSQRLVGKKSLAKLSFSFPILAVMATFFGEVLSVYSRAVEEEDEDIVENEEDEEIRRELEKKR